ncbi:hypothetical protein FB451DRAFT_1178133 [Mycena latifolia]|nr:hypothetical protein FB451DRAFT_1178133 [Mycena latifolia]
MDEIHGERYVGWKEVRYNLTHQRGYKQEHGKVKEWTHPKQILRPQPFPPTGRGSWARRGGRPRRRRGFGVGVGVGGDVGRLGIRKVQMGDLSADCWEYEDDLQKGGITDQQRGQQLSVESLSHFKHLWVL